MPVAESSVLRPRHADRTNPDDWPIFTLTNAYVVSQTTGLPCSLLAANKDNKVKVVGRLGEVNEEDSHLILDASNANRTVQLGNVTTYSFGQHTDGTYGFWAAGEAGWFELEETVAEYKPFLDEMNVATSMLYFIADKIGRSRKTDFTGAEFNKHIRRLFHDYHMQAKFPELFVDVTDVREGFETHRHFLISSILEGQEGIVWNEAPLLKYFAIRFPDDVRYHKSRIFGSKIDPRPVETRIEKPPSPQREAVPQKKRRGRPPKDSQNPQPRTPTSNRDDSRDRMNIDFEGGVLEVDDDIDDGRVPNQRKRKSILQPSGSKYSKKAKKGAGRRRSRLIPENPYPSDNEDEQQEQRGDDSPITIIANGEQLREIANQRTTRRKASQSPPPPDFLPRKFIELKVFDIDVQDTRPQGPGDLWTCPFEGCFSRVHDGLSELGKKRINDHLKSHQHSAHDRIHLALNESRPYLPVDNLVRRLQAVAPNPGIENLEDPARQFVAPIRRKY